MQHLQYGISSLSKFTIAHRLPLLRVTSRHIIFLIPSLRPASPSPPPLATAMHHRFCARLTIRALPIIVLYCLYRLGPKCADSCGSKELHIRWCPLPLTREVAYLGGGMSKYWDSLGCHTKQYIGIIYSSIPAWHPDCCLHETRI